MFLFPILALISDLDMLDSPLVNALPPTFETISVLNDSNIGSDYRIPMIEFNVRRPGETLWGVNILPGPIGSMERMYVKVRLSGPNDCIRDIRMILQDKTTSEYSRVNLCTEYTIDWSSTTNDEDVHHWDND